MDRDEREPQPADGRWPEYPGVPNSSMVGVLGGMGPLATVDFLHKLVAAVPGARDQDHVPVMLYSDPTTPDRTAAGLGDGPSPLPAMLRGVRFLDDAGVGIIVIPCNSAHRWFEELRAAVGAPIVHIAEAVVTRLLAAGHLPGERIGILSTEGTRRCRIYTDRLEASGFFPVVPGQQMMAELVTPGIAAVKAGDLDLGRRLLRVAAERLQEQGATTTILGCTDISVVLNETDEEHDLIDSNVSLAHAAIGALAACAGRSSHEYSQRDSGSCPTVPQQRPPDS